MPDDTSYTVHLPEACFELDLEAANPKEWAKAAAAERLGSDAPEAAKKALAKDYLTHLEDARDKNAGVAAVIQPRPDAPIAALVLVKQLKVPAEERYPEMLLAALTDEGRQGVVGEPDIRQVILPGGPTVRAREIIQDRPQDGQASLAEKVSNFVFPPELHEDLIEVVVWWDSLGLGDVFAEAADEIAASLTFQPAGDGHA